MSLTFCNFFAGIGGFRLGLERAGHRCVWSCLPKARTHVAEKPSTPHASGARPHGGVLPAVALRGLRATRRRGDLPSSIALGDTSP